MVTTELNQRQHVTVASATVIGATLASGLVAVLDPAIAGSAAPHPTLAGSLTDWLGIAAQNLQVLAAPLVLWLVGANQSRLGRQAGDVVMLAVIAVNAIPVGVALGRWRTQLIPYVPQLPLEWAALTLCITAWLQLRTGHATRGRIARYAAAILAITATAAAVETFATPHAHAQTQARRVQPVSRSAVSLGAGAGVGCHQRDCAPGGRDAARSLTLPSPRLRSVPLDRPSAFLGFVNHPRTPTGGTTT